ncbi:hypothetical protein [Plantactinospora sp. GCM10030261]|uniref:hypothetical protein n=1 Tax=Plantactinospora sp. GCM10030261 TaxID=3273420 RepID=UPI00360F224C
MPVPDRSPPPGPPRWTWPLRQMPHGRRPAGDRAAPRASGRYAAGQLLALVLVALLALPALPALILVVLWLRHRDTATRRR